MWNKIDLRPLLNCDGKEEKVANIQGVFYCPLPISVPNRKVPTRAVVPRNLSSCMFIDKFLFSIEELKKDHNHIHILLINLPA